MLGQPPALAAGAGAGEVRQSVRGAVEKIEKVVRFGAFWCKAGSIRVRGARFRSASSRVAAPCLGTAERFRTRFRRAEKIEKVMQYDAF